jgi:hypothetical protein
MITWLKDLWNDVGFRSFNELVFDFDSALTFGDEVEVVIILVQLFVLGAQDALWGLKHGVHSLDNVANHLVFVVVLVHKQLRGNLVSGYCFLKDLDGADNSVCLRDTLAHKVI